jgi:ATP-dependent RNA helicase DeaD
LPKFLLMSFFEQLGLQDELLHAVKDLQFEQPTEIQQKAIPHLLAGTTDFIGLAQTGTGKTAAFGLPILQLSESNVKLPTALIICPTRELCVQIENDLLQFKKYKKGIFTVAVYGGASISLQIKQIRKGVQIVVATPGRLIDLIERKAIDLNEVEYVVLDEADEMLNMGFQDDIEFILSNTPSRKSTWLFSATMPTEIKKVTRKYMNQPMEIQVGTVNTTNVNIDHQYYVTSSQQRYETLKRLIDFNPGIYSIIFVRTKLMAQEITEKLVREGYDIDALHGDLSQPQREKVLNEFKDKAIKILVATDVAARGIDVKDITHVINYELPDDPEAYTHRSGRTARAGKTGVCMNIISRSENYKIKKIEQIAKSKFNKLEIPSGTDVCRKQFMFFMDKLHNAPINSGSYETYLPLLKNKFDDMSKEEILMRIASLEFDRFLTYYENAEDLNLRQDDRKAGRGRDNFERQDRRGDKRGGRNDRRDGGGERREFISESGNFKRLFINLGSKDGFYKASFLQYILDLSNLRKDNLGRIDMKDMNSYVEIEPKYSKQMMQALNGKTFKGRKIRMNEADR